MSLPTSSSPTARVDRVRHGACLTGDLHFPETTLNFIRIGHQTRLQFGLTEVVIESPFILTIEGLNLNSIRPRGGILANYERSIPPHFVPRPSMPMPL
jgi:hypothetical protein